MWQAHLLRSVVVTRRALYQRPEGRDACVPWARGVDAGGAAMAWSSLQCLLSCIGFEIIKAHKYFVTFCNLLICHYPSRPHPLFLEILVASEKKQTWACSPTVVGLDGWQHCILDDLPFLGSIQMWNVLMDFVDFQYSWNMSVNSYSISMRVTPLDSYKKCKSGGYKYV